MIKISKFSQFISIVREMENFTFDDIKKHLLVKFKDIEIITINHRMLYYFELLVMGDYIIGSTDSSFKIQKEIPLTLTIEQCQRLK